MKIKEKKKNDLFDLEKKVDGCSLIMSNANNEDKSKHKQFFRTRTNQ